MIADLHRAMLWVGSLGLAKLWWVVYQSGQDPTPRQLAALAVCGACILAGCVPWRTTPGSGEVRT